MTTTQRIRTITVRLGRDMKARFSLRKGTQFVFRVHTHKEIETINYLGSYAQLTELAQRLKVDAFKVELWAVHPKLDDTPTLPHLDVSYLLRAHT